MTCLFCKCYNENQNPKDDSNIYGNTDLEQLEQFWKRTHVEDSHYMISRLIELLKIMRYCHKTNRSMDQNDEFQKKLTYTQSIDVLIKLPKEFSGENVFFVKHFEHQHDITSGKFLS